MDPELGEKDRKCSKSAHKVQPFIVGISKRENRKKKMVRRSSLVAQQVKNPA